MRIVNWICNFLYSFHALIVVLVDRHEDEVYCRRYPGLRELTNCLVRRADRIEACHATVSRADGFSDPDFTVCLV